MRRIVLVLSVSGVLLMIGVAPGVASQAPPSARSAGITTCMRMSSGKLCVTIIDRKWKRVCTYLYMGSMVVKRCNKLRR
jgi:hypothetical protein